jgi:hypothetical protein
MLPYFLQKKLAGYCKIIVKLLPGKHVLHQRFP